MIDADTDDTQMGTTRRQEQKVRGTAAASVGGRARETRVVATQDEAIEMARKLLSKSDGTEVFLCRVDARDREAFRVVWATDLASSFRDEGCDDQPNADLAAALDEAKRMTPRFATTQELFDALEKQGHD